MSTFLVVNNSSIACETTASEPYLKVNNNGYLPLTTESGTYTYTRTSTRISESTYESVESDVAGYSGFTVTGVEPLETKSLEIQRISSSTFRRYNGGSADMKSTQSLYFVLDGTGNNTVTFTEKNSISIKISEIISSTKNTVSRTNFNNKSGYNIEKIAVNQNGDMFLGEMSSSFYDTYRSSRTITAASLIGTQTLVTQKTSIFETLTGYKYSSLSFIETFSSEEIMPDITVPTTSNITHTLTDTFTATVTETIAGENVPLLTNSSRTYYLVTT